MKKYLALIMASVFACALVLSTAFANEEESNVTGSPIETAAQLASACETGGDYYLSKDISLNSGDLSKGSMHVKTAVNLNMNGKTITLCADGNPISTIPFIVDNGASLKIDRSTPTAGVGGITQKDGTRLTCTLIKVEGSGSLTLRHNISNINLEASASVIELTGENSAMKIDGASFASCKNTGGSIVWIAKGTLDFASGSFDSCSCTTNASRPASPLTVGLDTATGVKATANIAENAYFSNCSSSSETASCGSAISVSDYGTVNFAGLIQDCKSGKYGAAVCVEMGGTFNMNGGSIKGGSSASYGAVYVGQKDAYASMPPARYGTFNMKGGEICDDIDSAGSMIYAGYGGSFNLEKGTIPAAKKATQGGCVTVDTGGKFLATGGEIKAYAQGALFKGGCIYSKGVVELYKCSVDGNGAEVTQGGLIYMAPPASGENLSTVKIAAGATLKNGAAYDSATGEAGKGGAVYVEGGSLTIDGFGDLSSSGCVIENCSADTAGGAVYLKSGRLEMGRDSMVRNCSAAYTPSSTQSNANHVSYGGAFYIESGEVNLQNGTIENCKTTSSGSTGYAGHGGAIYVQSFSAFKTANAFEIKACTTQGNGGGICFGVEAPISRETTAQLDAVRVHGCSATNGGAVWAGNGGFYEMNLRAYQCTATEYGGAAYFDGCKITLTGEVTNCTAQKCGGVYVGCAAEVAKTGQTSLKMTGKLVINSNTAQDTSFGKNLFLDYRGEAFTKFAPTTTPFEVSLEGLSQDSAIGLAVTDSALDYCGKGVIQLSADCWDLRNCFTLETSGQVLASHDNQQALLIVAKTNQISTAAEYKAAREAGGEYFLMNDLDLSKDPEGAGQFKKSFTLNFQFHWLTIETTKGIGFDITNGGTVQLGTAAEGTNFEGGIRGTSDGLRTASNSYQMIRVREGGCLYLATNIQNVGNCMYPYDGSAISIDGSDTNQAKVYITAGTISHFYDTDSPLISVGTRSKLSISGLTIKDNDETATNCFIKAASNSELKAVNSSFIGASKARDVSFICASYSANVELQYCTFSGLNSTDYGCIACDNEAIATLTGCTFKNCTAKKGGAVYADNSSVTTNGNTVFTNCKATENGGAINGSKLKLDMSDTTFDHCSACYGGAVEMIFGDFKAKGVKAYACSASENGGAFSLHTDGDEAIVESCTISKCTAQNSGGGIYSVRKLTVSGGTIEGCTAGSDGGAIYYTAFPHCELTVNGTITENVAQRGGGIFVDKAPVIISGDIKRNKATKLGGGIAFGENENELRSVTLTSGCVIALNSSDGVAGGIWMPVGTFMAKLTLTDSARVVNNVANGAASNLYLETAKLQSDTSADLTSDAVVNDAIGNVNASWTIFEGAEAKLAKQTTFVTLATDEDNQDESALVSQDESALAAQGEDLSGYQIDATNFTGTIGVSVDAAGVTAWPYGFASATADSARGFVSDSVDYETSFNSTKQCAEIDKYSDGKKGPDNPVDPDNPSTSGGSTDSSNGASASNGSASSGMASTGDSLGTILPIIALIAVAAVVVIVVAIVRSRKR